MKDGKANRPVSDGKDGSANSCASRACGTERRAGEARSERSAVLAIDTFVNVLSSVH